MRILKFGISLELGAWILELFPYTSSMPDTVTIVRPQTGHTEKTDPRETPEPGYLVICWNDPVNLMIYVTHVFQMVFAWPKEKAKRHMLQVHENGKSLLVKETFEKAEHYVHQLQSYGLHATMERDE